MPKSLDRHLFAQGGRCFFCNDHLPRERASIEHIIPTSKGGTSADDNCVACCVALNMLLGSMPVKEKMRIILNQGGRFTCPSKINNLAAKQVASPKPKA